MAKYQLKEPEVDILKITGLTYTLEDGSTKAAPVPVGLNYITQTDAVISDADVAAKYVAVPDATPLP